MRRAIAYSAFGPLAGSEPRLPMDAPTRRTANHFGDKALIGIKTSLDLAHWVPINRPYAGQGAEVLAFPILQPSRAAPDMARVAMGSAQNFFSPFHHSNILSDTIPPKAIVPTKDIKMPPKYGSRGSGGKFIYPFPGVSPNWPTSSEWLAGKTIR